MKPVNGVGHAYGLYRNKSAESSGQKSQTDERSTSTTSSSTAGKSGSPATSSASSSDATITDTSATTQKSPATSSPTLKSSTEASVAIDTSGSAVRTRYVIADRAQTGETQRFKDPRIDDVVLAIKELREKLGLQADETASLSESVDEIGSRLDKILTSAPSQDSESQPATNVINVNISGIASRNRSQAVGTLLANVASGIEAVETREPQNFEQWLSLSQAENQILDTQLAGSTFDATT